MLESIGDRIETAIKNSGLSKTEVSKRCGVSKQAVSGWISTSSINKSNLKKLCQITGANHDWILDGKTRTNDAPLAIQEQAANYNAEPSAQLAAELGHEFMYVLGQLNETEQSVALTLLYGPAIAREIIKGPRKRHRIAIKKMPSLVKSKKTKVRANIST